MKTRRMILTRGLLAPFITLMLVCGILVYYFAVYSRDQIEKALVRTASDQRHLIDQFLNERASDLRFAASSHSIEKISDQAGLAKIFRHLQAKSQAFLDLGVFDERGKHLAYVGPFDLAGKSYSEAEWFKEVREKELYISDVFLGYRNVPHFIIAVRQIEGAKSWYLRATIDTVYFNDLVERIRIGKTGEAYLVNRKGLFQTKRPSGGNLRAPDPDYNSYQINHRNLTVFSARDHVNQRYLCAAAPLRHTDWVLIVRQEAGDAYASLTRSLLIAVIVILVGGTVAVAMAYILASGLANRLTVAVLEKQQMKTQLIMAGQLAEVGEMSAGLAHEINNPLQVMKSEHAMIAELLSEMEKSLQPPGQEHVRLIKDSVEQLDIQVERCKRITQGLLNVARKTEGAMQRVKLPEFMSEIARMIEPRAQVENIRVVLKLDPDLPSIVSDPNQLQQVLLNLLNNAMHALKNKDSGELRISVSNEEPFVNISVADNGCGISPENLEKIFLPFFTTKPVGQGTGLGLSTVLGIAKGLGGEITVTSELNAGTTVNVRVPLEPAEGAEAQGSSPLKEGPQNGCHSALAGG